MNIFAKVCPKCHHVHQNRSIIAFDEKRYCLQLIHNITMCMCSIDSLDYWQEKEIDKK